LRSASRGGQWIFTEGKGGKLAHTVGLKVLLRGGNKLDSGELVSFHDVSDLIGFPEVSSR